MSALIRLGAASAKPQGKKHGCIIPILVFLLLMGLVGSCSNASDNTSPSATTDSSSTTASSSAAQNTSEPTATQSRPPRNGFSVDTNIDVKVAGVTFAIPSYYQLKPGDGSMDYYYADSESYSDAMISVQTDATAFASEDEFEAGKAEMVQGVIGGLDSLSENSVEQQESTVAGMPACIVKASGTNEGKATSTTFIVFYNKGTFELGFVGFIQNDEASYDYYPDFEKVIATSNVTAPTTPEEPAGPTAAEAKLTATTKYLEYSKKKTDPIPLVTCDMKDATVTSDGKINLSSVGKLKVTYTITLGDTTATQDVSFKVRDTKAPKISFVNAKPRINQGEEFDALANMEYVRDPVDGKLQYVESAPKAAGKKAGQEVFYDAGWYTIEGSVDSSTPGTYNLLVTASDKHGNVKTRELPVTVVEVVEEAAEDPVYTYIVNVNTGVFHLPGCRDVSRMKDSNKMEVTATRDEMMNRYRPCGHCYP